MHNLWDVLYTHKNTMIAVIYYTPWDAYVREWTIANWTLRNKRLQSTSSKRVIPDYILPSFDSSSLHIYKNSAFENFTPRTHQEYT